MVPAFTNNRITDMQSVSDAGISSISTVMATLVEFESRAGWKL
jgi:hypothetical protein